MNAEHVAGRRQDLVLKFLSECEKSREALAFSRRSVQQMEDRDAEDWTQVCSDGARSHLLQENGGSDARDYAPLG